VAYTSHPNSLMNLQTHSCPLIQPSYLPYRIVSCALRFIYISTRDEGTCTSYQCDDHGVEVEEEHDQMESKLDETLFLVTIKSAENLRRIQHMMSIQHPAINPRGIREILVYVPCDERDVKEQRQPVPIHKEQQC
jgi:hypothetical protein